MKKILSLLAFTLLLAACGSLSMQKEAGANLARLKKVYIEHRLADGRGIDDLIVRELRRLGYDASCGPLTMTPQDAEAIVDYRDEWTFDFSLYMIELDLQVRDAHTGKILAKASYRHPSLGSSSTLGMIQSAVDPIFPQR